MPLPRSLSFFAPPLDCPLEEKGTACSLTLGELKLVRDDGRVIFWSCPLISRVTWRFLHRNNFSILPRTIPEPQQNSYQYYNNHDHDNTQRYQPISHGIAGTGLGNRRFVSFGYTLKIFDACAVLR